MACIRYQYANCVSRQRAYHTNSLNAKCMNLSFVKKYTTTPIFLPDYTKTVKFE